MKKLISWLKNNWKQIILLTVLVLGVGYVFEIEGTKTGVKEKTEIKSEVVNDKNFEYKGENGKDALTILKNKTAVEQDKNGMVVSINGRKAETEKREFWGFYVNGKMAQVGAADFKTKDADVINWKIENY
jgi:hypothetical protein